MRMRIKHNIQRVCGYINFVSGKLCSHENLMHRNKELRNTRTLAEHRRNNRIVAEQSEHHGRVEHVKSSGTT